MDGVTDGVTEYPVKNLEKRVGKGFDYLFEREDRKDTGGNYEEHFAAWEDLLRRYEAALSALGRTAA